MANLAKVADKAVELIVEDGVPAAKAAKGVASPAGRIAGSPSQVNRALDDLVQKHNAKVKGEEPPEIKPTASWEDYFEVESNMSTNYGRFRKQVEEDPEGVMANIWGQRGAMQEDPDNFIRSVDAKSRLEGGENPASVFADTGWYQGVDGNMKFHASEKHIKVNTDKMFNKAKHRWLTSGMDDGYTFAMRAPLSDVLTSDGLFKAYPHLKDTEVTVHFKFMGEDPKTGEPIFGIYQKERAGRGTLGSAEYPTRDAPGGKINVFNSLNDQWGNDLGRSTILHEVEHLIQKYEGFSEGASATGLRQIAEAAAEVRIDLQLLEMLEQNRIYSGMPSKERIEIIEELAAGFGDELDEAGMAFKWYSDAVDRAINKEWSDIPSERFMLETAWAGWIGDAALALRMPDQTLDEVKSMLNTARFKDLWDQAYTRYKNSGGEVEARIVQLFDGMRKGEYDRLMIARQAAGPEDFVDVIAQPVEGGKKNIAVENLRDVLDPSSLAENGVIPIDGIADLNKLESDKSYSFIITGDGDIKVWDSNLGKPEDLFDVSDAYEYGDTTYDNIQDMAFKEGEYTELADLKREPKTAQELFADIGRPPADDPDLIKAIEHNKQAMAKFDKMHNKVTVENTLHGTGPKVEADLFKNPNETTFMRWARKHFQGMDPDDALVRVITDVEGNVYVWDANLALHDDMVRATGMRVAWWDEWTDVDGIEFTDLFNQLRMDEGLPNY